MLQRLGLEPVYHPAQTCCGQPAFNSGYWDQAIRAAKHFIEVFENDEVVICPSGSCVCMVKYHYPELLQHESAWQKRARDMSARIYELSQYIVDILKIEDVGASYFCKAAYHESCRNLRDLGVSEQPKKLIKAVKGTELVSLNEADVCCGFGGDFSINFPSISEEIVKQKTQHFLNSSADILILSEPGCLLNINGYLSRYHPEKKVIHIASLLGSDFQSM